MFLSNRYKYKCHDEMFWTFGLQKKNRKRAGVCQVARNHNNPGLGPDWVACYMSPPPPPPLSITTAVD